MSNTQTGRNIVFSAEEKYALYIEGVRCAFSEVEIFVEDGMIPRMSFAVPATPQMRRLDRRARVHFIVEEPTPMPRTDANGRPYYGLPVMFEGEVSGYGYQKTPESKYLSFNVNHVIAHLDQFEITALDPLANIESLLNGRASVEPQVVTVSGNILELFTIENLVKILKKHKRPLALESGSNSPFLTIRDFVWGAYLMYRDIFAVSRVSETYTNDAMRFHQIIARFQTPDAKMLDWNQFQNKLMAAFLSYGLQGIGGKLSFIELLRQVCQYFLHQVTIIPNAESVGKQIQIKPVTHFNAIPRCNVIYPAMTNTYSYQENWDGRPTRMRATFLPTSLSPSADMRTLARYFTVYAPGELHWRWGKIVEAVKPTTPQDSPTSDAAKKKIDVTDFKKAPDAIPFVTQEEDTKGILSTDYPLPPMLNYTIMSQVSTTTREMLEAQQTSTAGMNDNEANAAIYKSLTAGDPLSRALKYRAFLCMALGNAGGIKNGRFSGSTVKYPQAPKELRALSGMSAPGNLPYFVPKKLTYVPVPIKIDPTNLHNTHQQEIFNTGVNYLITKTGLIIEVIPRRFNLFGQPELPLGIAVSGLTKGDTDELNNRIAPIGVSFVDWRSQFEFLTNDLTMTPEALAATLIREQQPAHPSALLPSKYVVIDTHPSARNHSNKRSKFENMYPAISEGTTTLSLWAGNGVVTTTTIIKKVKVSETLFTLELASAVMPLGLPINIKISTKALEPNVKPWLIITGKSPSISQQALNQIESNSLADRGVHGGPVGNVVVGFETVGVTVSEAQVRAAAFVTAAIQEMTFKNIGELKAPLNRAGRATVLTDAAIQDASYYYGRAVDPTTAALDPGVVANIKRQAAVIGDGLFKDFNTWDEELTKGNADPITPTIDVSISTPDDTALPDPERFASDAAFAPATPGASTVPTQVIDAPSKDFDIGTLERIIENYMAAFLNVQFYSARVAQQSFTAEVAWNPYMTVGYPCLVLDSAATGYDLVGYLQAVRYRFTSTSVNQQATYTHLRPSLGRTDAPVDFENPLALKREAMIPFFNKPGKQYIFVMPSDKNVNYANLAKYKSYLDLNTLYLNDPLFPIQLYDLKSKKLPPFMYGGGFGLNEAGVSAGTKKATRSYATYAVYLGYNEDQDNQKALPEAENRFVFADTIDDLDRGLTLTEAYRQVWRGIQQVGQNNLAWAQASLVALAGDFEPEVVPTNPLLRRAHDGPSTAVESAGTVRKLTPEIQVYQTPPTFDAKGVVQNAGTAIAFDSTIRALVAAHNKQIREHHALDGTDAR